MRAIFNQLTYLRYWTTETWTFIVAAVALAQPWLIGVYKKLLKSGRVEIYETGTPEIGFSGLGPTVSLFGTLRAREREFFVHYAKLELRELATTTSRDFEWLAFRPLTSVVGSPQPEIELTLPASFMINPLQPEQYNIVFSEQIGRDAVQALLVRVQSEWSEFFTTSEKVSKLRSRPTDPQKLSEIQQLVYQDFAATTGYADFTMEFLGLIPWRAGIYEITLVVTTAQPDKTYSKSWLLSLTKEMIEPLRANAKIVFEGVCKNLLLQHNFAYPQYYPNTRVSLDLLRKNRCLL